MNRLFFALLLGGVFFSGCEKDKDEIELPTLYTEEVEVLGDQHAMVSGIVSDDGGGIIDSRGFCWSVNPEPTITAGVVQNEGEGTGSFSTEMSNLQSGNIYYVRAFATNEAGTAYGNQRTFETMELKHFDYFGATIYVNTYDEPATYVWGPFNTFIGATSQGYGPGNTSTISAHEIYTAAKQCNQLQTFGHNDWYLPAIFELEAMYEHRDELEYFVAEYYWSSTELDSAKANAVQFTTGETVAQPKNAGRACRCIRKEGG